MEIPGLQIVFILIVLAEWIFMGSTQVFRGYMAESWEMPVGLKSAGYAAAFGILFAYYIGERLIYRKKPDGSQPIVLRRRGILWALLFYVPYLLYGFAGNVIFLFWENGRKEGAVFFLVKLLAFIGLCVKLYKMPKERGATSALHGTIRPKLDNGQNAWELLFRICVIGFFILMWSGPVFLRFQGFIITDIISLLKPLMLIYIVICPVHGKYKD